MAKRRTTPGTGQLNLEVKQTILERFREFVRARGETQRQAVERAIIRDMANPPDPEEYPPLPPVTVPKPAQKQRK